MASSKLMPSSSNSPSISVDDLLRNIYDSSATTSAADDEDPALTLEDFLARAGAVGDEDVGIPSSVASMGVGVPCFGAETGVNCQFGGGRGKRRATEEAVTVVVDKATQQKQRRMIKNRESAARSRERKQAYTVELEEKVYHLEEENACLLREEAEQNRERLKQLMETVIPVLERRRPPRALRRVHSIG